MTATAREKEMMKAEIRIRYGSLRAFEQAKNLTPDSMRDVLRGRASRHAEVALSQELGKPLHVLFPERYRDPESGEASTKRDSSAHERDSQSQSARAA